MRDYAARQLFHTEVFDRPRHVDHVLEQMEEEVLLTLWRAGDVPVGRGMWDMWMERLGPDGEWFATAQVRIIGQPAA